MRVLRGRAETPERDREATGRLLDRAADGEAGVRVWTPHRQVAFGRRDVRAAGFEEARAAAEAAGFPAVERRVGGRAVAYTGTTLAFVRAEPVADFRRGMADRYERALRPAQRTLWRLGVPAGREEPEDAFCPGARALSCRGKIVGVAQRVRADAAVVAGVLVVDGHEETASVLDPVYEALDVPFDPDGVGSVERAGGRADPEAARRTLERLLVGDASTTHVPAASTDV